MDVYNNILGKFKSKTVTVKHKDKVLKEGVFSDWKCHPFFIEILIETFKGLEKIKLFYPFEYEEYGNDVSGENLEFYFDYRLSSLNKALGSSYKTSEVANFSHHKFFNTIVSIKQI